MPRKRRSTAAIRHGLEASAGVVRLTIGVEPVTCVLRFALDNEGSNDAGLFVDLTDEAAESVAQGIMEMIAVARQSRQGKFIHQAYYD